MICIDDAKLIQEATNTQGVYHASVSRRIKKVFLDGREIEAAIFVDTNRGIVITHKRNLDGKYCIVDDSLVYDFHFGLVTVEQ